MAKKTKSKPVLLAPKCRPDSFTRSELLRAIRKVAAARRGRQQTAVANGAK
jgi:hypothetical protein